MRLRFNNNFLLSFVIAPVRQIRGQYIILLLYNCRVHILKKNTEVGQTLLNSTYFHMPKTVIFKTWDSPSQCAAMRVLCLDSGIQLSVLPFFFHSTFLSHLIQLQALFEIMAEQPQRRMKAVDERTLRKDLDLESKFQMQQLKQRSEKLYWEKESINTKEQKKKSKNKNSPQEKMSEELALKKKRMSYQRYQKGK